LKNPYETQVAQANLSFVVDDGVRFWLNGNLLLNAWGPQSPTTYYMFIELPANSCVPFIVQYRQINGRAVARMDWSYRSAGSTSWPPSHLVSTFFLRQPDCDVSPQPFAPSVATAPAIAPTDAPVAVPTDTPVAPPTDTCIGIQAEYFNNTDLGGLPIASRLEMYIDLAHAPGSSPNALEALEISTKYSVKWSGCIKNPLRSGDADVELTFQSDDGIRVYLNDALVLDYWTDHPTRTNSSRAVLPSQSCTNLRVEYYQHLGFAKARMSWTYRALGSSDPPLGPFLVSFSDLRALSCPSELAPSISAGPSADLAPPAAPLDVPTAVPEAAPVRAPVRAPVDAPLSPPATQPSGSPNSAAAGIPTAPPVKSPFAPAAAPIAVPAAAPTAAPPVRAPVASPTAQPAAPPVGAPVASPTAQPTAPPVRTPFAAPTAQPAASPISAPVQEPVAAPLNAPVSAPGACQKSGVWAQYWNNPSFSGSPSAIRTEGVVNLYWGGGIPRGLTVFDNFTVRLTTCLKNPLGDQEATAMLRFDADDGIRVKYDGQMIIDDWTLTNDDTIRETTVTLPSSSTIPCIPVEIEFIDRSGVAFLFWSWSYAPASGGAFSIEDTVPNESLEVDCVFSS
jgi:hypothetical protein